MKDMEIGDKIGRYLIQSKLGAGGMGTVYKAKDTHLERVVAIKLLLSLVASNPQASQRFLREAKTSAKLRHPNIVTVYDFAREGEKYYLVMDYIEGFPLDTLLAKKKIGVIFACKIMIQILSAMAHAHKQNIIHRDIKPANILLDASGRPYLSDFGLAKALSGDSTKISQTGAIMGTPCYMSPEQAAADPSRPVDTRSDIYSMGAVFYEMLTGKAPFQGDSIFNILYKLANEPVIKPRELNPKIPPYLEKVCLKALEKKQENRYQTVQDMGQAIEDYLKKPKSLNLTQGRSVYPKVDKTGIVPTINRALGVQLRKSKTYVSACVANVSAAKAKKNWLQHYGLVFASIVVVIALILANESQSSQREEVKPNVKQPQHVVAKNETNSSENLQNETTDGDNQLEDDEAVDEDNNTNKEKENPHIESNRKQKALQAFNTLRALLEKADFQDDYCSAEFIEEDLPDEEARKAFRLYGKKLLAGEMTPREWKNGVKLQTSHNDFYMIEQHGYWKYDGTNLQRITRKKNLQKFQGNEYRKCQQVYWDIAAMTMQGKAADICDESLQEWQREIILMRARRIFMYSFVRARELYHTPNPDIAVFLLDVVEQEQKRRVKLIIRREKGRWMLADIR